MGETHLIIAEKEPLAGLLLPMQTGRERGLEDVSTAVQDTPEL